MQHVVHAQDSWYRFGHGFYIARLRYVGGERERSIIEGRRWNSNRNKMETGEPEGGIKIESLEDRKAVQLTWWFSLCDVSFFHRPYRNVGLIRTSLPLNHFVIRIRAQAFTLIQNVTGNSIELELLIHEKIGSMTSARNNWKSEQLAWTFLSLDICKCAYLFGHIQRGAE